MNKFILSIIASAVLSACASTNSDESIPQPKSIKGQGEVVSILEVDKAHQEIAVKLVNGTVVPINVPTAASYKMGQKVYIDRPVKGDATVKPL